MVGARSGTDSLIFVKEHYALRYREMTILATPCSWRRWTAGPSADALTVGAG